MDDTFIEAIKAVIPFEERLSIKKGFYVGLLVEKDDWSFLIKLHALIEAALSHLLAELISVSVKKYLPDDKKPKELEELFSWLELSNSRMGKVAFVKALDIFPKEHRRFISSLSQLRNQLVHKVRNVDFQFSEYIQTLNQEQTEKFIQAFSYGLRERIVTEGKETPREEWIKREPRAAVWYSGLYCMSEIAGCLGYVNQTESLDNLKAELFDKQQEFINVISKKLKSDPLIPTPISLKPRPHRRQSRKANNSRDAP